jgi:hypothetical protein
MSALISALWREVGANSSARFSASFNIPRNSSSGEPSLFFAAAASDCARIITNFMDVERSIFLPP